MLKYNVLIIDDDIVRVEKHYERLFQEDKDFSFVCLRHRDELDGERLKAFDVVLLDVNLDMWGLLLRRAFEIIGACCPIVLTSRRWADRQTHQRISEALSDVKHVKIAGTLAVNDLEGDNWRDFASSARSQLRLVIAQHRHQGLLDLEADEPIRVLHLSDPQYGDPNEENLAFLAEREIERFVLGTLKLKIHLIAITGDITYSGQQHEYLMAESKLKALVLKFMPNLSDWRERLLLVPGNHDVNLRVASADYVRYKFSAAEPITIDPSSMDTSHRRFGLQGFRDFAWRLSGNTNWRDANDLLWINDSFLHLGVRFYLLSSVAGVSARNPKAYAIPTEALSQLVHGDSTDEDVFGVALAHHGPSIDLDDTEESIANWRLVAKALQNSPIRMLLHGHGHARHADLVALTETTKHTRKADGAYGRNELFRVMAPTTHLNGKKRPEKVRRGFNLVTLRRGNGSVQGVDVESYELTANRPQRAEGGHWSVTVLL